MASQQSSIDKSNEPYTFTSHFKKAPLNEFDNLIILPAFDMTRYRGIPIDDSIRCKIFGKPKEHSIQTMLMAGKQAYPDAKHNQ